MQVEHRIVTDDDQILGADAGSWMTSNAKRSERGV